MKTEGLDGCVDAGRLKAGEGELMNGSVDEKKTGPPDQLISSKKSTNEFVVQWMSRSGNQRINESVKRCVKDIIVLL